MYIKIDSKNRVIMQIEEQFADELTVDNVTSFKVSAVPMVAENELLCFNADTQEFYAETVVVTEEQKEKAEARFLAEQKKAAALKWLTDNDWKVNKYILGEWKESDERWTEYLSGRAQARADIDSAEAVLNA